MKTFLSGREKEKGTENEKVILWIIDFMFYRFECNTSGANARRGRKEK
ncbi:hypothetical protein [Bacillus pseudomycoides]|nr:hypothetical protein [Bacillus pseudomycoides]OOG92750.1 hypothetical protein BTH41_04772 [Bacillus mycoides]